MRAQRMLLPVLKARHIGPVRIGVLGLGLLVAACSSTDPQNQLDQDKAAASDASAIVTGSTNPRAHDAPPGAVKTAAARAPAVTDLNATALPGACPPGRVPSEAQTLRTLDQHCTKLRQEGEVWQRARKLAIQNRGEAGGRMADLHSPWSKENMTFYVDNCSPRQQKSREQTLNRLDPRQLAAQCG